jgi:hypothetical protein
MFYKDVVKVLVDFLQLTEELRFYRPAVLNVCPFFKVNRAFHQGIVLFGGLYFVHTVSIVPERNPF